MRFFNIDNFKELKAKTEIDYYKIGRVDCPALRLKIVFNADGWHHLRYDQCRKERNKKSQYNKFFYFHDGVSVIKKSAAIQSYRRCLFPAGSPDKSGFRKTKLIEWFGLEAVISFKNRIRIRVVIRRIGADEGRYHFWSVMPIWNLSGGIRIIGPKQMEDE